MRGFLAGGTSGINLGIAEAFAWAGGRIGAELEAVVGFAQIDRIRGRLAPTAEGRLFFPDVGASFADWTACARRPPESEISGRGRFVSPAYPFLPSHPGHATARRQMSAGSGMLALGLRDGFDGARLFMNRLSLFGRAVSLGDAESLAMHPASLARARQLVRPEARLAAGIGEDLIRLSVGLEDENDLIDDLRHALAAA